MFVFGFSGGCVGLLWGLAVAVVFSTVTVINSVVAGTFCVCYVLI